LIQSLSFFRRPGLAPGPITTGGQLVCSLGVASFFNNKGSGARVPSQDRDDENFAATTGRVSKQKRRAVGARRFRFNATIRD
jgi:hypothetical protein